MAKKSAVNRNEMVRRLVKTKAAKRLALKAIANDENLSLDERFEARLKLAAMPRNSVCAQCCRDLLKWSRSMAAWGAGCWQRAKT